MPQSNRPATLDRWMDDVDRRLQRLERTPVLGLSTARAGSTEWQDISGTEQIKVGLQEDGTYAVKVGSIVLYATGPNAGQIIGQIIGGSSGDFAVTGNFSVGGAATITGGLVSAHALGLGVQVIPYVSTITPDAKAGNVVLIGTLTGGITVSAPANPLLGGFLWFQFQQDGTGGRTIAFASGYKTSWTPSTSANLRNTIGFVCLDATANTWVQTFSATGLPA